MGLLIFLQFLPGREPEIQDQDTGEDISVDEDADEWRGNGGEERNIPADETGTTTGKLEVIGTVKNKEVRSEFAKNNFFFSTLFRILDAIISK